MQLDYIQSITIQETFQHLLYAIRQHRKWHLREQCAAGIHPAVKKAMSMYRPDRLSLLALEFPHFADSEPNRVAYTQNDDKGERDIQTVTSIGKYLKRHFTYMPDHVIRDITAMYSGHSYEILRTMPEMLNALMSAPTSCMNNSNWTGGGIDNHPYNVYDPKFGWALAISKQGSDITGRCLINDNDKIFVRSYNNGAAFSHSSEGIEMWLREHGYTKASSWEGCAIAHIIRRTSYGSEYTLAPYLDGDVKNIDIHADKGYCDIVEGGAFVCERTDGHLDDYQAYHCEDCGDSMCEDDMYSVGYHGDRHVCSGCIEDYVHAIGCRGEEYYVPRNNAIWVESSDTYYDEDYTDRNNIVYLEDTNEHEHLDHAIHLAYRDEYVSTDCDYYVWVESSDTHEHIEDVVRLHDDTYCLRDNAWQCSHSLEWYSDDEEFVMLPCGSTVHPDEVENMKEGE